MRPLPDVHGRAARGASGDHNNDGPSTFSLPAPPQMTYFLGDEATIGSSASQPSTPSNLHHNRSKDPHHHLHHRKFTAPAEVEHYTNRPPRSLHHHDNNHHHRGLDKEKETTPNSSSLRGKAPQEQHVHSSIEDDDFTFPSSHSKPSLPPSLSPILPLLSGLPSYSGSALSSISSRRNSIESFSDAGLSMIDSFHDLSEPDHHHHHQDPQLPEAEAALDETAITPLADSGSAPQLVMPSIKMPSRRPFTTEGKSMGRLKVLVAGDSRVGKTSLIKAIVQTCEHIVHVDAITPGELLGLGAGPTTAIGGNDNIKKKGKEKEGGAAGTKKITEIYASTKPYPEWWSEVDDLMVLRRRKSLGDDAVLDRNVCFVDTPGCGGISAMETITPVTEYIQAHLDRISSNELGDGDVLNMLGGEGGVQVDVVFYMVTNRLRPVDIHYLRQMAPLTNVILLLAQSDLMSAQQVTAAKEQIHSQLKEADIKPFTFSIPSSNYSFSSSSSSSSSSSDHGNKGIYAVSTATGSDNDNMDASLLMSPDYVQPLYASELETLVNQVFNNNGASWLRHSAARKYVQWRKGETRQASQMSPRRSLSMTSSFGLNSSHNHQVLTPPMGATSSYALARITDHTQREERLAQVRLANWAADLQKSLAREQSQYAALARGERAIWLTERINECVKEGTLVPVNNGQQSCGRGRSTSSGLRPSSRQQQQQQQQVVRRPPQQQNQGQQVQFLWNPPPNSVTREGRQSSKRGQKEREKEKQNQSWQRQSELDPLGLLEVAADLRHKGLIALEVVGSLSVLGGLAIWVSRNYAVGCQVGGWVLGEWDRIGCGNGR